MTRKKLASAILLGLSLAGCAEMIAAQRRADEQRCFGEGFRTGTDSFRLCRLTIEQARERRAADELEDFRKRSAESEKNFDNWLDENRKRREEDEQRRKAEEDRRRAEEDRRRWAEEEAKRMRCMGKPLGTPCI